MSPKVEEVQVDPAEVERARRAAEIEAERIEALTGAFLRQHPRLVPAQVTITKVEDDYKVETEGAAYVGRFLSGQMAAFAPCDLKDTRVLLGPPVTVAIPQPAEPAPVPVVGLDPVAEDRSVLATIERLGALAELCRVQLRGVADVETDEIIRLREACPLSAVNVEGRALSPEVPLVLIAQRGAEARWNVDRLETLLGEASRLLADLRPRVRSALMDVKTARAGHGSLRDLGSLSNLGQIQEERVSAHVEALDDLDDHLGRLERALAEANQVLPLYQDGARRHVRAVVVVSREVGLALRVQALAQIKLAVEQLRHPRRGELEAEAACAGLDVKDLPKLKYPADPLEPPTLR